MQKKVIFLFSILITIIYIGCGPSPYGSDCYRTYFVKPPDWRTSELRDSTMNYYSQFLKGLKIFLDAGHGGEDRNNKGPKRVVVEADLNLRVALSLKSYLEQAGAIVFISRDIDKTVSLVDRSKMANESGADIFVSVHHNAPGKSGDVYTNYTSTYFHATQKDYEFDPCNQDIAKYIQRDLAYVMGNSGGLGSFDGTYSDYMIYPKQGFAVLRNTTIPAALIEGSFFTSEYEEQRLAQEEFNQIQAWGVFRGIGKYFRAGATTITFKEEPNLTEDNQIIFLKIDDKNKGIDTSFCSVLIDKKQARGEFMIIGEEKILVIKASDYLTKGNHEISVIVKNMNGNHSFPFRKNFEVK